MRPGPFLMGKLHSLRKWILAWEEAWQCGMAWERQSDPGLRWQLCYDFSARSWWMLVLITEVS
ncbi:hypothetical protein PAMP_009633 [Pampus punctatissimus]